MKKIFYVAVLILLFGLLSACSSTETKLKPLAANQVILAFGDSLTFGTGATPETSYPNQLERMLNIKVINAGIPGEETRDSLNRINTVLDQYLPRLVIVCLGGNDLLRQRPTQQIKENLIKIIKAIQMHGAEVILLGVPVPSYDLRVPDFYEEIGNEMNIITDTTTMRDLLLKPEYKSDAIHLNAAGYHALAEQIAALLKKHGAISES